MANIVINKTAFLDAPITVDSLHGMTFTNESGAHQFVISAMQGGNPLALTGSVSARFMRANNTTILLTGSVTNGKAVITLHQDCYNVPGRFQLAIFNTVSGTTTCIYAAIGTVQRTVAGDLIDSGEAVPDISELLAQIDACEQATAAANAAATKAVRYDSAQTLTYAQKVQARANVDGASVGDVNNLKSALSFYNFGLFNGRIDWNTTNNTVTLGTGFFIYGGSYTGISSATTLAYTDFNNTTALVCNGSTFSFVPFNKLINGATLALFNANKMYTPFSYDNVYLNGNKITTANILNDFVPFVNEIDEKIEEIISLKSLSTFYNYGLCTSRIDWDTVNKTVTIGSGYFVYGGNHKSISTSISLSYTNFNNVTVLLFNGTDFEFAPYNSLVNGAAIALFFTDKMYMPFDYSKVYVNGHKIATANMLNDFVPFIDSIIQDVDGISTEIEAISGKLDVFFPETTVYDENNVTSSNATNDNIWIPKELTIPANAIVTTIDVYVKNNTQKTFSISFWNSETGEKYADKTYTLTPSQNVVSVPVNVQTTSPTKIGFYSASAFETVSVKNGYSMLYVEPSATSILNASTLAKWALNATIKAIVTNQDDTRVLSQEIHVGEGLAYTEIQQAIEAVTGDYATIIVHPKSTPYGRFSLMRSLSGSYPWSGLASVKHISIIGVDKTKCIVQSNTGNYNTPPAEIATNGIIKNLTFIATHTASDGTETTGSYAVHVDNRPADTNGMKLVFENCDFISYQTAAVGLGLYKNQDILFDRCNFQSHTDPTWKPSENYDSAYMCRLGAYFMHTTMGYAGGNMFIRFRDCFFHHTGGTYAMVINDGDSEKTAYLEAISNTLYCDGTLVSNNMMLRPWNHGNNADAINVS